MRTLHRLYHRLRCLFGHDLVMYPRNGRPQLHCDRCCNPHAYTLRELLRLGRSKTKTQWQRFFDLVSGAPNDEIPF